MLPLFCDYLKSEDTERADRALNAIEQLIEERTETPGGIIMSMLSGGKAPLDLSEAPELVKNLTNLLDRADKYMKIRIIVVLQSMGTASQDALPTLKKLADTTSDKSIKILSISAIQMIRPGHSMIKDIGDSVEIIKTIAE